MGTGRRKKKTGLVVLLIVSLSIMAILIVASAAKKFAIKVAEEFDSYTQSDEFEKALNSKPGSDTDAAIDYPDSEFEGCFFYDSLNEEDREVYEIYYDLVKHKDEADYERIITLDADSYEDRLEEIELIYYAMLEDHPEYFFLEDDAESCYNIQYSTLGKTALVYLSLNSGDSSIENIQTEKFNAAVDSFFSDIDLTRSQLEIELQIHDKLNALVTYDHDAVENIEEANLAHTAYGALVENSEGEPNMAVCDGYARAYYYLLKKAGIYSTIVFGEADDSSELRVKDLGHAWNLVRLDGEWYEVDCCWDDYDYSLMDSSYYTAVSNTQPQFFYTNHYFFNRTTSDLKDMPESEYTNFKIYGYEDWNAWYRSYHTRIFPLNDESATIDRYLNSFLPEATGTKYGLFYLPGELVPLDNDYVDPFFVEMDQKKSELDSVKNQIAASESELQNMSARLDELANTYSQTGDESYIDSYNALLDEYNQKYNDYTNLINSYNIMVDNYNSKYAN